MGVFGSFRIMGLCNHYSDSFLLWLRTGQEHTAVFSSSEALGGLHSTMLHPMSNVLFAIGTQIIFAPMHQVQATCNTCSYGYYCEANAFFDNDPFFSKCVICPVGTFANTVNPSSCTLCPSVTQKGSTVCLQASAPSSAPASSSYSPASSPSSSPSSASPSTSTDSGSNNLGAILGGTFGVLALGGIGVAVKFNLCQHLHCISCFNKTIVVQGGSQGKAKKSSSGGGGGGSAGRGGNQGGGEGVEDEEEEVTDEKV
jgi:hypothetical protein